MKRGLRKKRSSECRYSDTGVERETTSARAGAAKIAMARSRGSQSLPVRFCCARRSSMTSTSPAYGLGVLISHI